MDDITKILSSFGVPTAVAFFLLIQLQPKIEELTKTVLIFSQKFETFVKSLDEAVKKIDEMTEKVDGLKDCMNRRRKV